MDYNTKLFIKDLCARIPYGVKIIAQDFKKNTALTVTGIANYHVDSPVPVITIECVDGTSKYGIPHNIVKLVLRPMSSMTNEECKQLALILPKYFTVNPEYIKVSDEHIITVEDMETIMNFYNSHYLDYRHLIEFGLAIPDIYNIYNYGNNNTL